MYSILGRCFLYIVPDKQGKFIERMKPKEIGSRGSFFRPPYSSEVRGYALYAVCTQLPIPNWQTSEKYLRVQMLEFARRLWEFPMEKNSVL